INSCALGNGGCQHDCIQLTVMRHRCQCRPEYQLQEDGKRCVRRSPCADRNGGCMHTCQDRRGLAHCQCHTGYRLAEDRKACEEILFCTGKPMAPSPLFYHSLFSGKSLSSPSLTGFCLTNARKGHLKGIEMEIVNSCEANNGGCSHGCSHSSSGPVCTCPPGYELDTDQRTCIDVDDCVDSPCCQQVCTNTPGGYECGCYAGYRLSADGCGCEGFYGKRLKRAEELGEAARGPGRCLLQCPVDQGPEWPCICLICAACLAELDQSNPSLQWGVERVLSGPTSQGPPFCLDNSFGHDCSLTCDDCSNGGTCLPGLDGCDCPEGWTGLVCNQSEAGSGGEIVPAAPPGCPKSFYGKHCRKRCHCPNRGRCHRVYGACLCDPGLYGRFCHLACPPWAFGPGCSEECRCEQRNTQACDRRDGSCACKPGFWGEWCQHGVHLPT
uniref:EGF-like domain-containing protein n=1 Tax=Loxodonta africana TaxID=9785 RepID=G3UFY6_LOXAF